MTQRSLSAFEPVLTTIITLLKASTDVTGQVSTTGIYTDVPQGSGYPYIEVGEPTEVPWDTWGCYGKQLTVQVKAVTGDENRGPQKGARMLSACISALNFSHTTAVTSHGLYGMTYDNGSFYSEMVGGVRIRHAAGIFRVWVMQST